MFASLYSENNVVCMYCIIISRASKNILKTRSPEKSSGRYHHRHKEKLYDPN